MAGEIRTIAVLGAGTMGAGIAQVCAFNGYSVNLYDVSEQIIDRSLKTINKSLERFVEKGKIEEANKKATISRITTFTDVLENISEADLVIEALPEQFDLKINVFKKIGDKVHTEVILASNTSSLPITALSMAIENHDRFIGIHFMNPVPIMKGVEVIKGRETSEETLQTVKLFVESLGKIPSIAVDYAGFITSRLLNIYLNEAALAVMDGNTPEEVDKAMVTCTNMPIGPCKLLDLVGIDVAVFVLQILEDEFGERFKCAPLLKQMARAKHLGVKTGKGFYNY